MKHAFEDVRRFMLATGQLDDTDTDVARLYLNLCREEDKELFDAFHGLHAVAPNDDVTRKHLKAEVLDGIVDSIWVRIGLALAMGLPVVDGWDELARSNLAKILPDGTVLRNEHGKVMKPEGWTPPDLHGVLAGTVPLRDAAAVDALMSAAHAAHPLEHVFDGCLQQAVSGKGEQRHGKGTPFMEQPWLFHARRHGLGFLTGQAEKKLGEAQGFEDDARWEAEMLGAINYMAMAVIYRRLQRAERLISSSKGE